MSRQDDLKKDHNKGASGRKPGSTQDVERGERVKKILEKIFPEGTSGRKKAASLEVSSSQLIGYESGANIDNRALARIAELGGDVVYILTGRPTEEVSAAAPEPAPTRPELDAALGNVLGILVERHRWVCSRHMESADSWLKILRRIEGDLEPIAQAMADQKADQPDERRRHA